MEVLTEQDLSQFTGTENYYSYLMGLKLTDGVKYMVEKAGAYWLLDAIARAQMKHQSIPFQLWELIKDGKGGAILTMKEDSNQPELVRVKIRYTDFPLERIKLYLIEKVLLLPSEY